MPEVKSLVAKLAEVMAAIHHLPKTGWNDHFKYSFAAETDVSAAVRSELAARGVVVLPRAVGEPRRLEIATSKGSRYITEITFDLVFTDGSDSVTVTVVGQGEDSGDKGANKALTAAVKYGLLKTFLIPTGEDPDANAPSKPTKAESSPLDLAKAKIKAKMASLDGELHEQARTCLAELQIQTPADITLKNGPKALAALTELAEAASNVASAQ